MMGSSGQAITSWLKTRTGHWQTLDRDLEGQLDRRASTASELMALVQGLQSLARDLSLAREVMPNNRIAAYLERLYLRAHEIVYRPARSTWQDLKGTVVRDAPRVVREIRGHLVATISIFLCSLLVGWLLVTEHPELAALFASSEMIEQTQQGALWTEDLLNILPSSVLSLAIITNNLVVTLFAFALGAFFGLGTLYIISLNGLMLGGVFAFTAQFGLDGRLFDFAIAHGVVELSVVCVAGAAGVGLGEALIRPGARTRAEAFRAAVSRAGTLLVVAAPFLVGAGLIEGFVSPDLAYSRGQRLIIGVSYGLLFWMVLTGVAFRSRSRHTEYGESGKSVAPPPRNHSTQ